MEQKKNKAITQDKKEFEGPKINRRAAIQATGLAATALAANAIGAGTAVRRRPGNGYLSATLLQANQVCEKQQLLLPGH
ncbi:MAG: hypothetical protein ACYTBJ_07955 [Planctomycetota bacterium]|jgi:hypothetical protein